MGGHWSIKACFINYLHILKGPFSCVAVVIDFLWRWACHPFPLCFLRNFLPLKKLIHHLCASFFQPVKLHDSILLQKKCSLLGNQCGSWSAGFWRSQLIRVHTVFKRGYIQAQLGKGKCHFSYNYNFFLPVNSPLTPGCSYVIFPGIFSVR